MTAFVSFNSLKNSVFNGIFSFKRSLAMSHIKEILDKISYLNLLGHTIQVHF